jgi:hypothetical protein
LRQKNSFIPSKWEAKEVQKKKQNKTKFFHSHFVLVLNISFFNWSVD